MVSWVHIGETAALFAVAYALGCVIGFFAYRLTHRMRKPVVHEPAGVDLAAQIAGRLPDVEDAPQEEVVEAPSPPVLVERPVIAALPLAKVESHVPVRAIELAEALVEVVPEEAPAPEPVRAGKPRVLVKPRGGVRDDLKVIRGIGPKLEERLNGLGVFHLSQIAGWSKANAGWMSQELGFPGRVEREEWVKQAKGLVGKG